VDLSPTQEEFFTSSAFLLLMLGGKGSGKSHVSVVKAIQLAGINRGIDGGLLCPTLKMFKRDVLPLIKKICRKNRIPYHYKKSESEIYFPRSKNTIYIFHSEDDGESIAGPNLGWGVINEVTLCSYLAYAEFRSRIRVEGAKLPQLAMSGTPEDLAWVHEEFFEKEHSDFECLQISTRENKHNGPWYIKLLQETYDEQRQKAYIDGTLVVFNGRAAAWAFKKDKHVKSYDFEPTEIWVSLDFNVAPLAATIWYIPPTSKEFKFKMYAKKSLKIADDATTQKFCDLLWETLTELGFAKPVRKSDGTETWKLLKPLAIFPDPAGDNRSTRSHLSDIQILEDNGFDDIRYKKRITSVKDCLNSMNNLFDKGDIVINDDPKECKDLLTDLQRCKIKEDAFELDKSDLKRTHWLDGLKNMCDYEYPVINPNSIIEVS